MITHTRREIYRRRYRRLNQLGECTLFVYRRIRDLREDNDKTQSQIAEMLNMHLTVYQRYERGEREIPFWVAIKLADYYKVSLDYIAERDYK